MATVDPNDPDVIRIRNAIAPSANKEDVIVTALSTAGVNLARVVDEIASLTAWIGDGNKKWKLKDDKKQYLAGDPGVRMAEIAELDKTRSAMHLYLPNPAIDPEFTSPGPLAGMSAVDSRVIPTPASKSAAYAALETRLSEPNTPPPPAVNRP